MCNSAVKLKLGIHSILLCEVVLRNIVYIELEYRYKFLVGYQNRKIRGYRGELHITRRLILKVNIKAAV